MMDMYKARKAVMISIGMSIVYSLAFIYLMSEFAECIAWFCVILTQLGLIAGALLSGYLWSDSRQRVRKNAVLKKDEERWQRYYMAGAIILGLLALCFLLCMICEFQSLKLAIDVIDASADFLVGTKRIIIVPIVHFFMSVVVIIIWIYAFTYVISLNKVVANTAIPQMRSV